VQKDNIPSSSAKAFLDPLVRTNNTTKDLKITDLKNAKYVHKTAYSHTTTLGIKIKDAASKVLYSKIFENPFIARGASYFTSPDVIRSRLSKENPEFPRLLSEMSALQYITGSDNPSMVV
jgi:hypothetical protein